MSNYPITVSAEPRRSGPPVYAVAFSRERQAARRRNTRKTTFHQAQITIMPHRSGFTAIEVLLVLGFFSLLVAIAAPALRTAMTHNDLENASMLAVSALRRAQLLSRAVDGDAPWGVSSASGSVTLFRGSGFAARDPAFDDVQTFSDGLRVSGLTEVVFTKFSGLPQQTGTLTLTAPDNVTRSITLGTKGTVEY